MTNISRNITPPENKQAKKSLIWIVLFSLTAVCASALYVIGMPAVPLIGAIIAGIITAILFNSEIKVPKTIFMGAQSILGCMIAQIFTVAVIHSIADHWFFVLFSSFSMLICSVILGLVLTKYKVLPGTTALWGSLPGGASVMVILSESYGADMRLVAYMQYLRVMTVALLASFIAMCFGSESAAKSLSLTEYLFHPFEINSFILTLMFAFACTVIAHFLKLSSGPLLLAMAAGVLLNNLGIIPIELPQWLMIACYVLIGWSIGLRFTRQIVLYTVKIFPKVFGSILLLILICAGIAAFMVIAGGIDPLTAYLASSPGGADSVAIIAASTNVDMAFVMSVQVMRFVVILLIGPPLTRLAARYLQKKEREKVS